MVWAWARSAATRATSREFSPARPNAGSTPFCVMSPRPTTAYPICFGIVLFLSRCFLQNNLQARGHATSLHTGSIAVGDKGAEPGLPLRMLWLSRSPQLYLGLVIVSTCE